MNANKLKTELYKLKNPAKAKLLQRFFKTKKGEYAEGDKFLGIMVPQSRSLVKKYWQSLNLKEVDKLVKSPIHEERLTGLLILVKQFEFVNKNSHHSDLIRRFGSAQKIYKYYLSRTKYINNWDLVDLTAPKIFGAYLRNKNKSILIKLAKSNNLWERRIAILATFDFIYHKDPAWALKISKLLLQDKHDLIHKAVGWMLREIGKRCDEKLLTDFLDTHAKQMPRTMLRYSIERLPTNKKTYYLNLK
jgi:3-methyladenine DNA glycosylase AlkD